MGTTTSHELPYPELGDPPNVPTDMRELAEKIDTTLDEMVMAVPNSAGRPAHIAGRIVYQENDPGAIYVSNGTAWTRYVSSNTQRIQSGMGVWTTNAAGEILITFPTAFDSPPFMVVTDGDSGSYAHKVFGVYLPHWFNDAVGFMVRTFPENQPYVNAPVRVHWIAVGSVAP